MSHLLLSNRELEQLALKHPDKIPVFITKSPDAKDSIPDIRRHKFLVPSQFTMGEFIMTIRRWLILTPEQAIFIFIGNTLPMTGATMYELHEAHKSVDGVLRMTYASEHTFGHSMDDSFDVYD